MAKVPKCGILVSNLGSPNSPSKPDVARFLTEFLTDPYVISLPLPLRQLLVRGVIVPTRTERSAAAYASIWHLPGGPLRYHMNAICKSIAQRTQLPTSLGMRYGSPSIEHGFTELGDVRDILMVGVYPQHAFSTRTTMIEKARAALPVHRRLWVLKPFYENEGFQRLLAEHVTQKIPDHVEHLVVSFHGLPEQHLRLADPTNSHCLRQANCCHTPSIAHATCYRYQCLVTAEALTCQLDLPHTVSYQSRIGRQRWLEPSTESVIRRLAEQGVKILAVTCPAFTCDNLETLEEIGIAAKAVFLDAGGEELILAPSLNSEENWLELLVDWIHDRERMFERVA